MSLSKRSVEFQPDTVFNISQAELCERGMKPANVDRALAKAIADHPVPHEFHKPAEELSSPLMQALLKEYIVATLPASKSGKLQIVAKPA